MLDALGDDYTSIVVLCTPASGRVTVGGYMSFGRVILYKTKVALDPKTLIRDSRVQKSFEQQIKYSVASIHIRDLNLGKKWLANEISHLANIRNRIIIFDADCTRRY